MKNDLVRKDVFFLRFTGPHQKGMDLHPSLDAAKAAAWAMYRDSKGKPREILDWHMQPVLGPKELRQWLMVQDGQLPEIDDWDDELDFDP